MKNASWNLTNLYSSIDSPEIETDKKKIQAAVKGFYSKYKKPQALNSAKKIKTALTDFESILDTLYRYLIFASLLNSKDTQSEKIGKFYQTSKEFANQINNDLLFFELELQKIPEKAFSAIIKSPELKDYVHYLKNIRKFSKHRLDETSEVLLSKKSQTGGSAFVRLYEEEASKLTYDFEYKGKSESLNYSELTTILSSDPKRQKRLAAAKAMTSTLQKSANRFKFILNNLLLDKKVEDEIRHYSYPEEETFLGYEIKPQTVAAMSEAITESYSIPEKFYLTKARLTGIKQLNESDRYSSIYADLDTKHKYTWNEAKEIIYEAFASFSDKFYKTAKLFFDNNWIDSELNKGKINGAFCSLGLPSTNPYILMNYTGNLRDIMVLAHELGHGIHAYLSRQQNTLNFWPSTVIAEIASVFCEFLVFDKLYAIETDKKIRTNLLGDKIQDIFATIYRQNAFFNFERELHQKRRAEGELAVEEINTLFQSHLQKMFGKGLTLSEGHSYWWIPISHIFKYNFYVFSYCFGETLAISTYSRYKSEGKSFVSKYTNALATGGSLSPYQITKLIGFDINNKNFWKEGVDLVAEFSKRINR